MLTLTQLLDPVSARFLY